MKVLIIIFILIISPPGATLAYGLIELAVRHSRKKEHPYIRRIK